MEHELAAHFSTDVFSEDGNAFDFQKVARPFDVLRSEIVSVFSERFQDTGAAEDLGLQVFLAGTELEQLLEEVIEELCEVTAAWAGQLGGEGDGVQGSGFG